VNDPLPKERSRAINHAILAATLVFSAVALATLVVVSATALEVSRVPPALVYGLSLLACSLASFLYHRRRESSPRRRLLRYCDHAAIFGLIAGTYTPFVADGVPGPLGFSLIGWVWGLAVLGALLKLVVDERYDEWFVALYLAIGWLFLTAPGEMISALTTPALVFLVIGGAAYSIGAVIFVRGLGRWTDAVWHGCVLGGVVTHFIAVLAVLLAAQTA